MAERVPFFLLNLYYSTKWLFHLEVLWRWSYHLGRPCGVWRLQHLLPASQGFRNLSGTAWKFYHHLMGTCLSSDTESILGKTWCEWETPELS